MSSFNSRDIDFLVYKNLQFYPILTPLPSSGICVLLLNHKKNLLLYNFPRPVAHHFCLIRPSTLVIIGTSELMGIQNFFGFENKAKTVLNLSFESVTFKNGFQWVDSLLI